MMLQHAQHDWLWHLPQPYSPGKSDACYGSCVLPTRHSENMLFWWKSVLAVERSPLNGIEDVKERTT
jgi:hypothetical protein